MRPVVFEQSVRDQPAQRNGLAVLRHGVGVTERFVKLGDWMPLPGGGGTSLRMSCLMVRKKGGRSGGSTPLKDAVTAIRDDRDRR